MVYSFALFTLGSVLGLVLYRNWRTGRDRRMQYGTYFMENGAFVYSRYSAMAPASLILAEFALLHVLFELGPPDSALLKWAVGIGLIAAAVWFCKELISPTRVRERLPFSELEREFSRKRL